jgi:hypothetical protein
MHGAIGSNGLRTGLFGRLGHGGAPAGCAHVPARVDDDDIAWFHVLGRGATDERVGWVLGGNGQRRTGDPPVAARRSNTAVHDAEAAGDLSGDASLPIACARYKFRVGSLEVDIDDVHVRFPR